MRASLFRLVLWSHERMSVNLLLLVSQELKKHPVTALFRLQLFCL